MAEGTLNTAQTVKFQGAKSDEPVIATLIRGRLYDAKGLVWSRDGVKAHPVTPEIEAYLRETAVDYVKIAGGSDGEEDVVARPRFRFSNDCTPAPRRRRQ